MNEKLLLKIGEPGPQETLVSKFRWKFPVWQGEPLDERVRKRYGRKAVLNHEGKPLFAELAIIPVLKKHGLIGAVWADNWGRCFRDAMPFAQCELPEPLRESYGSIVARNGGPNGCWDVIGWDSEGIMFVECKWTGKDWKDHMQPNGIKWLESALKTGIALGRFAICEWDLE